MGYEQIGQGLTNLGTLLGQGTATAAETRAEPVRKAFWLQEADKIKKREEDRAFKRNLATTILEQVLQEKEAEKVRDENNATSLKSALLEKVGKALEYTESTGAVEPTNRLQSLLDKIQESPNDYGGMKSLAGEAATAIGPLMSGIVEHKTAVAQNSAAMAGVDNRKKIAEASEAESKAELIGTKVDESKLFTIDADGNVMTAQELKALVGDLKETIRIGGTSNAGRPAVDARDAAVVELAALRKRKKYNTMDGALQGGYDKYKNDKKDEVAKKLNPALPDANQRVSDINETLKTLFDKMPEGKKASAQARLIKWIAKEGGSPSPGSDIRGADRFIREEFGLSQPAASKEKPVATAKPASKEKLPYDATEVKEVNGVKYYKVGNDWFKEKAGG